MRYDARVLHQHGAVTMRTARRDLGWFALLVSSALVLSLCAPPHLREAIAQRGAPTWIQPNLSPQSYLFAPGSSGGNNVYATWAGLYAALSSVNGPRFVVVDSSGGAATVPSGSYALDQVTFSGKSGTSSVLTFASGATMTAQQWYITGGLQLQNAGAVVWTPATDAAVDISYGAGLIGVTSPFVSLTGTVNVGFRLLAGAGLQNVSSPVVTVAVGASAVVNAYSDSPPTANSVTGAGTLTYEFDSSSPPPAQPGIGTYTKVPLSSVAAGNTVGILPASQQASQTMGGDVSGTTAAATVVALQGKAVSSTAPSTNNVLTWNGSAWAPAAAAGGLSAPVTGTTRTETTTYTVDSSGSDFVLFCDTTGGAWTLTLPAPTNGRYLVTVDSKGNFATANLTLAPHSTEKINGIAGNKVLSAAWSQYDIWSNGTDWFVN